MLGAKAAGYHGWPIFWVYCDAEGGFVSYLDRYEGLIIGKN